MSVWNYIIIILKAVLWKLGIFRVTIDPILFFPGNVRNKFFLEFSHEEFSKQGRWTLALWLWNLKFDFFELKQTYYVLSHQKFQHLILEKTDCCQFCRERDRDFATGLFVSFPGLKPQIYPLDPGLFLSKKIHPCCSLLSLIPTRLLLRITKWSSL